MMNINIVKIKEYNSTYKHILVVNGTPICIVRGNNSLNDCISYLMNGEPSLKDGKIKRLLDKVKGGEQG